MSENVGLFWEAGFEVAVSFPIFEGCERGEESEGSLGIRLALLLAQKWNDDDSSVPR